MKNKTDVIIMKYEELLLCIREEMGQLEMDGEYIVFQDEYQRDVQLMGVMEKAVIDYSYGDPAKARLEESKRRERGEENGCNQGTDESGERR